MEEKEEVKINLANLTPEQQDNIILERLNRHRKRGGTGGSKGGKNLWTEDALMVRRQVIIDYIAQGLGHERIVREIQRRWGVSLPPTYAYIKDAIKYLSTDIAEFNKHNYEVAVTRLENVLEDALADGNRKEALQAIDLLNKIQGLYVNKVEADVKADTTIEFKFGGE